VGTLRRITSRHAESPEIEATDTLRAAPTETSRPVLRGWLHLVSFFVTLVAGPILVAHAHTDGARAALTVYVVSLAALFGVSAAFHRIRWSPAGRRRMRRADHATIFLAIAGTYTPFALLLLPPDQTRSLLLIAWIGAIGGVLFTVFWVSAPRWLYTPIYVALGWVAVFYLKPLYEAGGAAVVILIAVGGLLYTLGAVVYGTKRPNPSPRWFGFHEVFHVLTVAAFVVHYIAVSMAVYASAPL